MKTKIVLCFVFCILCAATTTARDSRAKIKDYLNQEILIIDNFAGQSITLIRENKDYFILRKYFGSGIPLIGSIKYEVVFNSNYQITFSEVIDSSNVDLINTNENFILSVEEKGLSLYLNRLKIVIDENFLDKAK
ncbi:MAG: hypothetical protein LBI42_06840 [Chitinispirillales bacterium]|jgi:hypothetical protein|nr:hypothetical protein [Chitinispirillales bacterium]